MKEIIVQLFMAFSCSLGFAIVFGVRVGLMIPASLGATLSWAVYLIGLGFFISCLAGAAMAALYAEIQARVWKAPATLFLVPALIPLIPGSTLYYTMSGVVGRNWEMASDYGSRTLQYALAIAAGISLVWAVTSMIFYIVKKGNE